MLTSALHVRPRLPVGAIMSGSGAYQVGVLPAIAAMLPRGAANPFAIICGTSAGAINATSLVRSLPKACVIPRERRSPHRPIEIPTIPSDMENLKDEFRNLLNCPLTKLCETSCARNPAFTAQRWSA